ncbi:unnamed protein product [Citrullus colocynthis]|uniref:Uncharacterized protein n=1 Tax=Citrullus colocynthis TaxID=252529 RepID=A0ABP0XXN9_9ROSI
MATLSLTRTSFLASNRPQWLLLTMADKSARCRRTTGSITLPILLWRPFFFTVSLKTDHVIALDFIENAVKKIFKKRQIRDECGNDRT